MIFKAPYLPYDRIRHLASEFLAKNNPDQTIPVPIEEIIEFKLNMDIIPFPRLKIDFNVDGFLANNMSAIYVDDYTMDNYENRYRFTLAHEIGHKFLHNEIFEELNIQSLEDWMNVINLDFEQYT
ncbi:MAG: hypothetical protein CVT49_15610 [candidate division Zixibacteria bacterium HGW-Zixibacteria-1]|nr:MAG: hypothetical protein CVT49_15610 [candidate division Zixibacteria bacterium HGW-Zixibacteria-1]